MPTYTQDEQGQWWYINNVQRHRAEERDCAVCGETFKFIVARQKFQKGLYCSRACSNKGEKPGRLRSKGGKGRYINADGYVKILDPYGSRDVNGRLKFISEHRHVMAEHLGRPLYPTETVHHKNGNKLDNRVENLEMRIGPHGRGATEQHCRTCTCFEH